MSNIEEPSLKDLPEHAEKFIIECIKSIASRELDGLSLVKSCKRMTVNDLFSALDRYPGQFISHPPSTLENCVDVYAANDGSGWTVDVALWTVSGMSDMIVTFWIDASQSDGDLSEILDARVQ